MALNLETLPLDDLEALHDRVAREYLAKRATTEGDAIWDAFARVREELIRRGRASEDAG
jgi:hypothetical protein